MVLTRKPGFFKSKETPLYKLDTTVKNMQGKIIRTVEDFEGKLYVGGNYKIIEDILR